MTLYSFRAVVPKVGRRPPVCAKLLQAGEARQINLNINIFRTCATVGTELQFYFLGPIIKAVLLGLQELTGDFEGRNDTNCVDVEV